MRDLWDFVCDGVIFGEGWGWAAFRSAGVAAGLALMVLGAWIMTRGM